MNKYFLAISFLSFISLSKAQDSPFKKYGDHSKIITLSDGKYDEIQLNDTLQRIGSVIINTNSKKIVGFVEDDTLYSEATLEPEVVSRWYAMDPYVKKYPSLSPYSYCLNNPIRHIDIEGEFVVDANNQRVVFNYDENGNVSGISNMASLDKNTQTVLTNLMKTDYGSKMLGAMDKYMAADAKGKMEEEYFKFTFGKTDEGSAARTFDVSFKEGGKEKFGYELRLDVDDYKTDKRFTGLSKDAFIYLMSIHEPSHKVNPLAKGLTGDGNLETFSGAFGEIMPFNMEYAALLQWNAVNPESSEGLNNFKDKTLGQYIKFNPKLTMDDLYQPSIFGGSSLGGTDAQKTFMKKIGVQMGGTDKKVEKTVDAATGN